MTTVAVTVRERIERIEVECRGVWSAYGITSWERQRLAEWRDRSILSEKQMAILRMIEVKAFPNG